MQGVGQEETGAGGIVQEKEAKKLEEEEEDKKEGEGREGLEFFYFGVADEI
jgi:hypothetical protein